MPNDKIRIRRLGEIAPPWVVFPDVQVWVERRFRGRLRSLSAQDQKDLWYDLAQDLFAVVRRDTGEVRHQLKGASPATTKLPGQKVSIGENHQFVPWLKNSPHDDSKIVIADWDLADFDDTNFSIAGIWVVSPGNNGKRVRHAIEVRWSDVDRWFERWFPLWLDRRAGNETGKLRSARGIGARPAAVSKDGIGTKAPIAREVPTIIKPVAEIGSEPLVPMSFPAKTPTARGAPPSGFLTLRGAIRVTVLREKPDLLVVLGREYADAFFAEADLEQAVPVKQPPDDQLARQRTMHDHPHSIAGRHREASKRALAMTWSVAAKRLWQAIVSSILPVVAETRDGTLVKLPLLAVQEHVLPRVLHRDEVAWSDQHAPSQCGVGRPLVAEADVQRWLDGEALVDSRAMPGTSGAAAEPLRASAGRPVAQEPGSPPNWKPLMDALKWADAALGADARGLMKEWNQSDELPMRGRANGTTKVFQCHWFDFPAWWGPAADADGEIPSNDRPRCTRPDPAMANRLAPRPSRSTKDDILWFDQSAATAKGVDVPNRVSNILVEMTALRRLVREWSEQNIFRDVSEARTAEAEAGQTEVGGPPVEFMFIDTAVEQIKERLRISEGPALKRLLDIMHTGEVRTWKRTRKGLNGREKILPAAWEGAHVDLDVFRAQEQSGILFCGSHYHLHRFLISEEDLACWLSRAAPMTQAEIEPPGVAAAAVLADAQVMRNAAELESGPETQPLLPADYAMSSNKSGGGSLAGTGAMTDSDSTQTRQRKKLHERAWRRWEKRRLEDRTWTPLRLLADI